MRNSVNQIKKNTLYGVFILLLVGALCGCGINSDTLNNSHTSIQNSSSNMSGGHNSDNSGTYVAPVVEESKNEVVNSNSQVDEAIEEQLTYRSQHGITEDSIAICKQEQVGKYCYEMLDELQKTIYVEVLMCIDKELENIMISTNDSDELQYIFQCVYNDHPEIYWIDGYSYTRHTKGNEIIFLTFAGKYLYSIEDRSLNQIYIDQYVSKALAGVSANTSQYEKVKHVYEYIINHTEYKIDSKDNQTILSVFRYGESVCQGYAKAMQYLLNYLDVECTMVVGKVVTGEGHAWNLVKIDGAYYYVDPTWGDSSYSVDGLMQNNLDMPINYDYLNITTSDLLKTHEINNVVPMPQCISTAANYYYKENLYFDIYDENHLNVLFSEAYYNNKTSVTIKCANREVYNQMCDKLLNDQQIFNYLQGNIESVVYSVSEDNYTLSFWL